MNRSFKKFIEDHKLEVKVSGLRYHGHNSEMNRFILSKWDEVKEKKFPVTIYKIYSSGVHSKIVMNKK